MHHEQRAMHHELCFGCGTANLFGLQLELGERERGRTRGRFFVKQDHQGPHGTAHAGLLGAALEEAMALCVESSGSITTRAFSVELHEPAPVGAFVDVYSRVESQADREWRASAVASSDGARVASGTAVFAEVP